MHERAENGNDKEVIQSREQCHYLITDISVVGMQH
jgi:hypothetical protein